MVLNRLAATGLCALLLTACAGDDEPSGDPASPLVNPGATTRPSSSTSPSVVPSASGVAPIRPFQVQRADGTSAQDAARGVGIDPAGVVTTLTWSDQLGANTVVFRDIGDDIKDSELRLYVDHVVQVGDRATVLRQVKDSVADCPVDKLLEFVDEALQIQDLDRDGVGEVVFAYRLNCAGDVSPSALKVLLLEDGDKYILRGSSTNQFVEAGDAPVPEPAPVAWPAGSYSFALALYEQVQPES